MTTTTKDRVEEENLVAAAARAATEAASKTLATIRPEQQTWDENQLAILRALGVENASQAEVDLFFHYCRTTGLDPFRKQIYMIGRNTKITEWVEDDRAQNGRRKVDKWVTKYTIQTGIDGYRRNGREAAKANGDELSFEGPYFTGKDDFIVTDDGKVIQLWREVWHLDTPPHAAKYIISRNGEACPGIVLYSEFVQTVPIFEGYGQDRRKVGERPNENWSKSPCNQTAKCAEALSWRRAYPDDFAGLILEDSAQPTVIDEAGNVESGPAEQSKRRRGGRGTGGLRDRAAATEPKPEPEVVEGEVDDQPAAAQPGQDGGNDQSQGAEPSSGATPPSDSGDQEPSSVNGDTMASAAAPDEAQPKSGMRKAVENRLFKMTSNIHKFVGGPALTREERIALYNYVFDRTDITTTDDLDNPEVAAVADKLFQWGQDGTLVDEINEVRNLVAIAQAAADKENQ